MKKFIKKIWTVLNKKKKNESESFFYLCDDPNYKNWDIGYGTYGKPTVLNWDEKTKLSIGKFCSIADNVKIYLGGNHRNDWISTYPFKTLWQNKKPKLKQLQDDHISKGDVVIMNDVWIGNDAVILSGVTIGNGAIIGARTVVAKDVPDYAVIVGNPGKIIGKRFDENIISKLNKIGWWDFPLKEIEKIAGILMSDNVEKFIDKYDVKKVQLQ